MKTCTKCSIEKPEDAFGWQYKNKGIRFTICKECKNEANRAWYEKNKTAHKEKVYAATKARIARNRQWKYHYLLASGGCSEDGCENNNPLGLEFDHIDRSQKSADISVMVYNGASIESLENEAKKCRILCAYHHNIWTAEQMNTWAWRDNAYIEAKPAIAFVG